MLRETRLCIVVTDIQTENGIFENAKSHREFCGKIRMLTKNVRRRSTELLPLEMKTAFDTCLAVTHNDGEQPKMRKIY